MKNIILKFCLMSILLAGLLDCMTAICVGQEEQEVTRQDFDRTIKQWKGKCKELRKIGQYDFAIAFEHELDGLKEKRLEIIEEGNQLFLLGIDQAAKLYPELRDADLRNFLLSVRRRLLESGYFEKTLTVGLALLEGGSGDEKLTDMANMLTLVQVANYCSEYETAADLLTQVQAITNEELPTAWQKFLERQPELTAEWNAELEKRAAEEKAGTLPRVEFETSKGPVVVELFEDDAPNSVANVLDLVERGIYDGNTFYSAVQHGLALSGSTSNDGLNDSKYIIDGEQELESARGHYRRSLTLMTVQNGKQSGSIFAFCRVANPGMNGKHTVIGRVISGMSAIDRLNNSVTLNDQGQPSKVEKFEPDVIISAKIVRPSKKEIQVKRTEAVEVEVEKSDQ